MKKILLLNPPGKKNYMRDYYCSKISKASYCYHPIDFIILSGILSNGYKVKVLDCIAERVNEKEALKRISILAPDIIIFLIGAASMESDIPFLKYVKKQTKSLMVGIGDVLLNFGNEILKDNAFMDAVLLDFTTNDIVAFLENQESPFRNIIYKNNERIIEREEVHQNGIFSIGLPRHDLFKDINYSFPFAKQKKFSTVLTDFGCPFGCEYCVVNRFNHKVRDGLSIIEELKYLNRIGINEVVFKDQTFAVLRERTEFLCREIIRRGIKIGWTCFSRTDLMDYGMLTLMRSAGCHTIIFGVESSDQESLYRYYKRVNNNERIKEVLSLCKKIGIETVATFIIGLPYDTKRSIGESILFSKMCGCDYASFNIFTPAYGTKLRKRLVGDGTMADELNFMDSGISQPFKISKQLTPEEIWSLRRKAIVSFYGDPIFLLKNLKKNKSIIKKLNSIKEAVGLFKNL